MTVQTWLKSQDLKFSMETTDEITYYEETGLLFPIGISNSVDAEAYLEYLEEKENGNG